jgi:beta-lactamase regulating signal transducer with metallopeptidase domain
MSENFWQVAGAWTSYPLVVAFGGSLMHFLWQGLVLAALLAAALLVLRRQSPNVRYLVACAALAAMAACPTGTFIWLSNRSHSTLVENAPAAAPAPAYEMDLVAASRPRGNARLEAPPTRADGDTSAETPTQRSASISSVAFDPWRVLGPLAPWMVALWLAGVVALSARLCVGWLGVQRMRRHGVRPVPPGWEDRLARIAGQMRISRPVRLLESALIEAPTVIGWLRPIVLVPASAWVGLSPNQLEALLAHELAHVRRHDYALNFVQTSVETLLFYHPAVWWVSRTIRLEREACCDEIAVEICGDRREYARALASMEGLRGRGWRLAMAANGGQLIHRIRRIVGVPSPQSNRSAWWLMAAVVSSVFGVAAIDGLVGLQAGGLDDGDNQQIAEDEGWGPESGGLRCRVTPIAADADDESPDLTKQFASYARGEDVTLALELKNVSDKTVTLLGGKGNLPFLGPHLFDLEFTDTDGQPIPRSARGLLTSVVMLIESSTHEVEPQKTVVVALRPAKFNHPMDYKLPTGDYQVRVRYRVGQAFVEKIAKLWPDKPQGKAWAGEAISNGASFTVAEYPKAAKVAELRWGKSKGGLRAAVEFIHSEKRLPSDGSEAIPLNTALDVVIHIQNGWNDKSISFMSETWRQLDPVTVKDESGNEQTLTGPWYSGFPITARWTLKPKETAEIRAYALGIVAAEGPVAKFEHAIGPRFSATPGKYQVRYTVNLGNIQTSASQESDWKGELTTGETTLSIRARTPEEDAAERARHFTGRVEFVANDGKAVDAGVFTAQTYEASRSIEIHAGPIEVPDVTSPVTISVVAPGYEETRFAGVQLKRDETTRFELKPAEPTRFRLIADGRPVAGAKVRHFNKTSDNASGGPYPANGLQGPIHAESADDGTVVLASLQKVNQGYEDLGAAVYFLYIEAEGFAGRFLGPVRAGADLGDVALSRPLEVRGEIHGTPEELKNFAAEWDQPFELTTANPMAAWSYAVSQPLETKWDADKLTFHLTGLRPGNLRVISNFSPGTHHVSHTYARRNPGESDVVVELELTQSLDDLVITPAGRRPDDSGQ